MARTEIRIEDPLVIMFRDHAGEIITRIHRPKDFDHTHYGILVCDLVRHIARAVKVNENDVWEVVEKERANPTSGVRSAS